MFSYREFNALDLLELNLVNLDDKTVSFSVDFYSRYLSGHSKYCISAVSSDEVIGYIIGNSGPYRNTDTLYSHITALSISPWSRGFGLAQQLLRLYDFNAKSDRSEFTDLFVRESNKIAIDFYKKYGYINHQLIEGYYENPNENAYDMRLYTNTS